MVDFTKARKPVPTSIGTIELRFRDNPDLIIDGVPLRTGTFDIEVRDQNGAIIEHVTGDLAPYLTTTQNNGIDSLINAVRTKAANILT